MLRSGINFRFSHICKGKKKQRTRHRERILPPSPLISASDMLKLSLLIGFAVLRGAFGDVTLTPPPPCYSSCLSNELAAVGCAFADVCRVPLWRRLTEGS